MTSIKNFSLVLFTMFTISAAISANGNPTPDNTETIHTMVNEKFSNMNLGDYIDGKTKVFVNFMINENSELVVLSTNNEKVDSFIKSMLNYETIEDANLKVNKLYTLPLVLDVK